MCISEVYSLTLTKGWVLLYTYIIIYLIEKIIFQKFLLFKREKKSILGIGRRQLHASLRFRFKSNRIIFHTTKNLTVLFLFIF